MTGIKQAEFTAGQRKMKVYLDYSATTPLDKAVFDEMLPYFCEFYGNADSVHGYGRDAAYAVDTARRRIANALSAKAGEIYFTSGGTEADNWALKGLAFANKNRGARIIVSAVEHAAVLAPAEWLRGQGFEIVYLPVEKNGVVAPDTLEEALRGGKTALVSVMAANNETGTIQPIKELTRVAHEYGALMHTDAVQAAGSMGIDVSDWDVDALSLSAHKFYGPKGAGALYLKSGVAIDKLIAGGHQEKSMRGGTTAVPLAVGLGKALLDAVVNMEVNNAKIRAVRDLFVERLTASLPDIIYNGDARLRLPQNANFTFPKANGDALVMALDLAGVACSSGAACSSGSLEPSHVMKALGYNDEDAKKSVRFSFGRFVTKEQAEFCAETVVRVYKTLPSLSSLIADAPQNKRYV